MEKAAMSLAAAAVSPIITKLSEKALSYFGGDITEEELHHLKDIILPKIQTVIEAVDNINNDKLKRWVMNLRTAVYEAEDVLDMYEYNHLQAQVSPPPANSLEKFHRASKEFFAPVTLKTELKKCLEKLQKAYPEADKVFAPLIASTSANSTVPSDTADRTSSVSSPSSKVFGRDEECKSIVDILISEGDGPSNTNRESRIPILAIWGIGGDGKTTLAQYIFNDPRIKENFPLRLWVDLSGQLDMKKAYTKMLEDATETTNHPKESLDALQAWLKKHLESNKKFLLVLDDVWLDESHFPNRLHLDQLLIPFNDVRDTCSRILITTRAERTAELAGAENRVHLKELEFEHCWSIIEQSAGKDLRNIISDHPELVEKGDRIVDRLKHSPLAATLVGVRLGMKVDVDAWEMVLDGDILKDAWNASLWCYRSLPQHLQQCFSFCSLFRKGWLFDKSELISLWIAHDFVVVPSGNKLTVEDKGREYFNDLLSFSFFQHRPRRSNRYVIHDVLHELATKVSENHCYRIEDYEGDTQGTISPTVVHLSMNVTNRFVVDISKILELVNLRTFFIISISKVDFMNIFLDASKMFQTFKKLRVLHLGYNSMHELHSSICELKHLRYLRLRGVRRFPKSLGRLYHLHCLVLKNTCIGIVPRSVSNLINLKHFDVSPNPIIFEVPEFGKLISLQRLKVYDANRRRQCGIDQLKNLRELRGSLRIRKLQNVESKAEACEAMLKDKIRLDQLALEWDIDTERNDQAIGAEVLDGLEPPRNLKELEIHSYIGAKSPRWLENNQCLSKLQELKLFDCRNLQVLPPLGQLSFLSNLNIQNAKAVEGIGPEFYGSGRDSISFPRLKILELKKMEKWERWHRAEGVELHPCLEELVIEDCPKLMGMPSLPPSLRKLRIHNCPCLLRLPPFPCSLEEVDIKGPIGTEGDEGSRSSPSLTHLALGYHLRTLQSLCIDGCKNLSSLVGLGLLPSLQRLQILNCARLTLMRQPDDGVVGGALALLPLPSSVQSIQIKNCNEFSMPPGCLIGLTSLVELRIQGCPNLQSLPDLSDLRALRKLHVEACPELTCIGNLNCLTSLRKLTVLECPKLTRGGGGNGGGERDDGIVSSSIIQRIKIDETLLLSVLPLQEGALNSLQKLTIQGSSEEEDIEFPQEEEEEDIMLPHLTSLLELHLKNCQNLFTLPENLGNLISSLQSLEIDSCPNLKSLPNLENLSSLKKLSLEECFQFESLPNLDKLFSLQNLMISECSEMRSLPNLDELSSLESLDISDCPQIESLPHLEKLSSLKILNVSDCPQIESLPHLEKLFSLKSLYISSCPKIESLPGLGELSSLEFLDIKDCPEIELLPNLEKHASLNELCISRCPKIKSLQNLNLGKLSSLHYLQIVDFPQLKSLPSLPSSLETLEISRCHPELRKKYGMGGPLGHKLHHIPTIKGVDLEYKVGSDDMACSCCWPLYLLRHLTVSNNNSDHSAESDSDSDHSAE